MSEVLDIAMKNGRWTECPSCKEVIITQRLKENLWVCPNCGFHFRLSHDRRLDITCDSDSFEALSLPGESPAKNEGQVLADDVLKGGSASIKGYSCVVGVMDFSNRGGSMGVSTAQMVVFLMKSAQGLKKPLVLFCSSGGVRVQEGIWGLMQMLRTVHARNLVEDIPLITVFTDPCLGGVTASFASLADIMIAEPGARIGFAGPRVIESTINYKVPPDFHNAEKLLSSGFLDMVVHRHNMRDTLAYLLRWF
ncbi:MAG: acetyl-CoA carboxylase carboxyl transferase subunit beta [Deltaproteobacteria bacterium]|nr:acetyl-CoA carboxylase carboxyl transferase subunit beta [Deltaproteobacteria bacterium]